MAGDLQQTLEQISRKTLHLTERYEAIRQKLVEVQSELNERDKTIAELRQKVDELNIENEYLKVVTIAHPSRADVERSRAVISKLVRQIDKCINELNE
ncbi:MAG: hypothetical protein NC343_00995 [Muribaculum sp.]|nr:hypothetical protein [Muribaculaceae bacterium]MCM1080312.1 hypothetical protein [Muribaculum sp.]